MNGSAEKPAVPPVTPDTSVALLLHAHDNVATALQVLVGGQIVQLQGPTDGEHTVLLRESIGLCHKFALCDMAPGDMVRKYGEAIGRATTAIRAGDHVHVHNLRSNRAL